MRWCPKNHYHLIHESSFEMSSWSKLCTLHDPGDIHHLLSMIIQNVINDYLIDLSFSRTIAEMSDRINLPRNIVDRANNMFKVTVVTINIITIISHHITSSPSSPSLSLSSSSSGGSRWEKLEGPFQRRHSRSLSLYCLQVDIFSCCFPRLVC